MSVQAVKITQITNHKSQINPKKLIQNSVIKYTFGGKN